MSFAYIILFVVISLLIIFAAIFVHFYLFVRGRPTNRRKSLRLMVILGSGGHTTEALILTKSMDPSKYSCVTFVVAETDSTSIARLNAEELPFKNINTVKIPRSREVAQAWISTVATTFFAILFAVPVVFREKPDVIICNGPGTCIPICLVAFILNVLHCRRIVIIFVESFCRVRTLSLSGKILYHIADLFFIQYDYLKSRYPKSVFLGRIV